MRWRSALCCAFLFLLPCLCGSIALAQGKISGLRATVEGDQVLVSFRLDGGIDKQLLERIDTGLPTRIVYELELARDRKRWYDQGLRRNSLEITATYDAVARETNLHYRLSGELIESKTVRDRPALLEALRRIDRLPVFKTQGLTLGVRYLVLARAILGSRMVLAIIPTDVRTDWSESNKFRPPSVP